jgi:hypothetical protein
VRSKIIVVQIGAIVCLGCDSEVDRDSAPESTKAKLELARAVSEKYQAGVEVAEADGYVASSPCEESEQGSMGIHYVHPSKTAAPPNVGDPPILVYFPRRGALELVAIEYFQPVLQDGQPYVAPADQPPRADSLPSTPPQLFENLPFDGPMAGHNPEMPWHYDQHVWLYAENPAGLFSMWNPALDCPDPT